MTGRTTVLASSGAPRPPIADEGEQGDYQDLPTGSPNSWLRPRVLWRSRNDIVARIHDPVDAIRKNWLELQGVPPGAEGADALRIIGHEGVAEPSFMLLGDTGEGDGSQMAIVPGLVRMSEGANFSVICSDVIYPAGEASDYRAKFYRPYRELPGPVYAIPGNHDWYDRLVGFMTHFCDARSAPAVGLGFGGGKRGRFARLLWRKERAIDLDTVAGGKRLREANQRFPPQRGPYWSLDAGPLRLVGIDTGITGGLDSDQGAWLARVSGERPEATKILLTGKPLLVDGKYEPGEIAHTKDTVNDVLCNPDHGYVAVIGGDIHNYQRYLATLPDGRQLQYIVAGGGGAFMHATHKIPKIGRVDGVVGEVTEQETHFFPGRAWSLYWYAKLLRLPLTYTEAGAVVGEELGLQPLHPSGRELLERYRRDGWPRKVTAVRIVLYRNLPAPGKLFQRFLSEIVDRNEPPMAKSFLRFDVADGQLRIRCFQATGWRKDELAPPVEDEVTIPLIRPGRRLLGGAGDERGA